MIDRYLSTVYVKGARGPHEFDCYGLVRSARHEIFGKGMLPACGGIDPYDKRRLTDACHEVIDFCRLAEVRPRPGAIATAWRGSLCVHVGLVVQVDSLLMVLETDAPTGPCITSRRIFESRYRRTVYYDD